MSSREKLGRQSEPPQMPGNFPHARESRATSLKFRRYSFLGGSFRARLSPMSRTSSEPCQINFIPTWLIPHSITQFRRYAGKSQIESGDGELTSRLHRV